MSNDTNSILTAVLIMLPLGSFAFALVFFIGHTLMNASPSTQTSTEKKWGKIYLNALIVCVIMFALGMIPVFLRLGA